MKSGVLMMVNIKTAAFWDVTLWTLCSVVEGYQRFGGTDFFHHE
jgi:hypothetical protein